MIERPGPRDHHHSAGQGEDQDSLPSEDDEEVRAHPRSGIQMSTGPASPPATNDIRDTLNVKCHFEMMGVFQRRIRANTRTKSNLSK